MLVINTVKNITYIRFYDNSWVSWNLRENVYTICIFLENIGFLYYLPEKIHLPIIFLSYIIESSIIFLQYFILNSIAIAFNFWLG